MTKLEQSARERATLAVLGVLLVLLVAYPLFELVRTAFDGGWNAFWDALGGGGAAGAVWTTVWTGGLVTAISLVVGTAAAVVTERSQAGRRRWLRIGMLLPILIPPFVSAMGWAEAFGPAGLLEDLVGVDIPGVFGPAGVVLVISINAVPLAYLVVAAGLASRAEPDLERAARASGATPWRAFRTVTLPLLRPSLISAGGLVFVVAVNSFGIPVLLGTPGFETMTTRIYRSLALSADPEAFVGAVAVAASLVAITFLAVAVSDAWNWLGGAVVRTGAPTGTPAAGWRTRWPAIGLFGYVAITSLIPFLALCLRALTRAVGLSPWPTNWTLANFADAIDGAGGAFANSLLLGIAAASMAVILGGTVAALARTRKRGWLGSIPVMTFAVPGSALAAAILLAYGSRLRDSLLLILVAYLAKFWALGHRPIAGSLENLPLDAVRAARVSGAGWMTTIRTVVVPILWPAIAAAWVLVFLFSFHELTMSALLYGPGSETLAVVILNQRQLGDVTVTAAMAVTLTLVVLAGGGLLALVRRSGRNT